MVGDAAGHDTLVVAEVGLDVDRQAVERHPVADSDADGRDLVFARRAIGQGLFVGPDNPDADTASPALCGHVEAGKGSNGPFLEIPHVAADVLAPRAQVEHDVGHALAGAVICVLPASAGDVHRKARGLQQVRRGGTGACGVERRMFQQPDQFGRPSGADIGDTSLHGRQRL